MAYKLYLSHSALELYKSCGYKYYLKYKKRVKPFIPVRYPLVTGVAFHELVDSMYRAGNFDKTYLTRNWPKTFEAALDNEASSFADTEGYDKHIKYGYGLINKFYPYAKANGYLIEPISSEWNFKIPFGNDMLVGKTDLVIQREGIPYIEIIDFKTGRKLPTQKEVDENLQLTIYDWAVKKEKLGNVKTKVGLFFPRHDSIIYSERSKPDYIKALTEFSNLSKSIKNKQFEADTSSCKWCEFKDYCKFYKKPEKNKKKKV